MRVIPALPLMPNNATSELTRLVALVSDMAQKQQHIDSKMNRLEQSEQRRRDQMARDGRQRRSGNLICYACGEPGHFVRNYNKNAARWSPRPDNSNVKQCYESKEYGHLARDCANHLTMGGSKSLGGNAVRPETVSYNNSNFDIIPAQPFVKCQIDGVEVNALIDTGSMRTFICDNIQKIIDLDHRKLDTSVTERCESITGGALKILGRMPGKVKFCKNKKTCVGNFLVCTNIGCDCV